MTLFLTDFVWKPRLLLVINVVFGTVTSVWSASESDVSLEFYVFLENESTNFFLWFRRKHLFITICYKKNTVPDLLRRILLIIISKEIFKFATNQFIKHFRSSKHIYIACLHDQNISGFFGGPAFFQPIKAF